MAKKPQTEEKAKGLLKNVGNYKGKTLNLSKKQLGASGRAAAGARKIAISRTHYDAKTKKVIGPMGKPITGRVDLGGGNIAVYKNGVRVRAQAPSSKPKGSGGGGGGGGGGGSGGGGGQRDYSKGASQYRPMTTSTTKKTASIAGSIKARQAKFGGPGSSVQARQAKFGGMRVNEMDQPYRSGKTRPIPGKSEAARRYNESRRAYPSRRVAQEQEKVLDNALLVASMLPVGAGAARGAMAVRGISAAGRAAQAGAEQGLRSLGATATKQAAKQAAKKTATKAASAKKAAPVKKATPAKKAAKVK